VDAVLDAGTWTDLQADMPWEAVKKLADTFVTNQARELQAMKADLTSGDRDALRRRAHSLKGAARLLGASRLAEAAATFEGQSTTVEIDAGQAQIETLTRLFSQASEQIAAKVAKPSVAA
jgi:HPt (histidine-containing phosphotransfer) domain-containing protein